MMKKVLINSTMALIGAYILTILLHEMAHFLTAKTLGYQANLYHNRVVAHGDMSKIHEVLFAGIAPLFSLIQGVIFYLKSIKMRISGVSLFYLWFGIVGMITFFGYLMIAPLIQVGDTGKVFRLLEIPMFIQIVVAVIGAILITVILIKSTPAFERYATMDFGDVKTNRSKWSIALILIPLLVSILFVTLVQFPVTHFISILATICAPFSIMAIFGTFMGRRTPLPSSNQPHALVTHYSKFLITMLFLAVLLNRIMVIGL